MLYLLRLDALGTLCFFLCQYFFETTEALSFFCSSRNPFLLRALCFPAFESEPCEGILVTSYLLLFFLLFLFFFTRLCFFFFCFLLIFCASWHDHLLFFDSTSELPDRFLLIFSHSLVFLSYFASRSLTFQGSKDVVSL